LTILITGGAGYIGSHTCIALHEAGFTFVVFDNLCNSSGESLKRVEKIIGKPIDFVQGDIRDARALKAVFEKYAISSVIHFAGLKSIGESVSNSLKYYDNNVNGTLALCQVMKKYGCKKIVFSSSATVYGDQPSPLKENMELKKTTNPYGETKAMSERILTDTTFANDGFNVTLLRYFNPVGAHESGLIGEDPNGIPNNLMPFVTKVAKGQLEKLSVFGNDYDTIDGTGVRDYIHVVDLAKGHVKAIENLNDGVNIYNLGTGRGTSVLELVNAFMKVNDIDVPYEIVGRRPGDIATCYADASKAERELKWKAELGIEEMVRDAWKFEMNNK